MGRGSESSEHGKRSEPSEVDIRELASAVIDLLKDDDQFQAGMREVPGSLECTSQEQR